MTTLTVSLPDRPLSTSEISALESQHDDYGFAPVGFFPEQDVVAAFVVIIDGDRGYSLGFDRDDDWDEFEQVTAEPE
ncbi:MAG: hypothetical protein ABEH86_14045 [Haloarcula sp.]